ncbi:hypothetical protein F5B21DRAFT_525856 [Xylaria acuta]|nr:hypothetical protein F5B21DRAFT_525856 [Xylaria acuta]
MCGCRRATYIGLCTHKERQVQRCGVYQLRREGSCWAWCFPKCRTYARRYHVQRVCRDCEDYFRRKYGDHHYKKFIDYFLEYKERNGFGGTAIDPRTVPRGALLNRQSAPARVLATETKGQGSPAPARGQPFQVHQPMSRSIRQVNRPLTPMVTNEEADEDSEDDGDDGYGNGYDGWYPAPTAQVADEDVFTSPRVVANSPARLANKELARRMIAERQAAQRQTAQVNEQAARGDLRSLRANPVPANQQPAPVNRQGTPFPHNSIPRPNGTSSPGSTPDKVSLALALPPGADKPLPTDPSLFAVGDYEDEERDDYISSADGSDVGGVRIFTPSPPPKYNSNNIPAGHIVPELVHLAQGLLPQVIPEIQQPTPRTPKNQKPVVRNADSVSDVSIVKRFTKVAKDLHIPNIEYIDYNGKWVPRVITPPKGKRNTRTPTPSSPPTAGPSDHNVVPDHIANPGPYSYNSTTVIDIAIAPNAASGSLIPGKGKAKAKADKQDSSIEQFPSTYFVQTHRGVNSHTGTSARVQRSPSHESIAVPPPKRHDGILIPSSSHAKGGKSTGDREASRGAFFKERGLPSQTYIQEECRSATLAQTAPVLVHAPKRRYSAAVQSCFCDDKMKMSRNSDDKCLSCRERDAIAEDMNMTWV